MPKHNIGYTEHMKIIIMMGIIHMYINLTTRYRELRRKLLEF